MKRVASGFAREAMLGLALSAQAALAGGHADSTTWFDENYAGYKEDSTTKWTTTAGTWAKASASDMSAYSNDTKSVHLDTVGNELTFTPKSSSAANALVRVDCQIAFTICRDEEDWLYDTAKDQQAALGIREREDGKGLTFFVWRGRWKHGMDNGLSYGTWVDVSAPGLVPEAGKKYTVTVENDQSCLPSRLRYSVDGVPLADSTGETWLAARCSLKPWEATKAKKTSKIGFRGRGEVGEIVATQAASRSERAAVTLVRPTVAKVGTEISFTTRVLEGQTLGSNLSYRWYREDASGLRTQGSIAEGQSTYTITENDYGHWIAADVSDENGYAGTGRFWCSRLPVAYIDVVTNQYGVGTVYPQNKKITYDAHMLIAGNAEFDKQYEGAITIHVRGNSTAGEDKKPYKIKLDKKADLFGLGGGDNKNKHWVLLANAYDESLMRNKLSMDLSKKFGIVSMNSTWVDVILNGQFVGNYLLCQHIRVAPERINVYDWGDAAGKIAEKALEANPALTEDDKDAIEGVLENDAGWMTSGQFTYLTTNYTVITKATDKQKAGVGKDGSVTVVWKKFTTDISGGYVFEIDRKKIGGGESPAVSWFDMTNKGAKATLRLAVAMNSPEGAFLKNDTVRQTCWDKWWNIGQSWLSGNGLDGNGHHYRDLSNFDSMVGYFLTMYVTANNDAGAFSRYSYMDQGGKMFYGPGWDFDCGFGTLTIRTRAASTTNDMGRVRYAAIVPTGWIPGGGWDNFMCHWPADPYFSWKVREKYLEVRPYMADLVREGGLIDQYMTNLLSSARANDIRWNNRIGFLGDAEEKGDALVMKEFLTRRIEWFDAQFATVGKTLDNIKNAVSATNLRYTRNTNLKIAFDGAVKRTGSVETDMTDAGANFPAEGSVTTRVTIPSGQSATAVQVSVNGYSNATWQVSSGVAVGQIPLSALEREANNFIGCDAVDATGKVLSRNVALLYRGVKGAVMIVE